MGPAVYGRYALLTSVSMWFALLSGLGAVSLITRDIPQFTASGDIAGLRKLVTNLPAFGAGTAVVSATAYFVIIVFALGERDLVAAAFVAGAVFAQTVGNLCFSLFLGLNRAARWGMGELLRRWLTTVFTLVGYPMAGVRGACFGYLAANLVVLAVGLAQAAPYIRWSTFDPTRRYLSPYLKSGTYFAAGNLLLALVHRSGETLVRLSTGDYVEVGYYGAAFSIYLTGANALWQFGISFAPYLVTSLQRGDTTAVTWVERLLKSMTIVAAVSTLAVVFVGPDLVPLVLGRAYQRVVWNLMPMTLALFTLSIGCIGRLVSLALDRPGVAAKAAAIELAAFWTIGSIAAAFGGSFAASVAALFGSALYAIYITSRMRRDLAYSVAGAMKAGGLASVVAPLVLLKAQWPVNTMLFVVAALVYAVLLVRLRMTMLEIAAVGRLLRPDRQVVVTPA
jgi:O-antigen/teichoic acid export membrane protein